MKTQIKSGLWGDQQQKYSKALEPIWNPKTKKHSSKLWKKLEDYPSSALLQARKLTERQKNLPSQSFASHNMQNTWRTSMWKMTAREWSSPTKMWR
ncbi:hypothetical protein RO3G_13564 [Rhizopus delemar RA 99-880]|uniref:Uncharacterized protein n=1 Tax=Rhizopus delemar (strain RA 99-880 / ATCC MYA-4621 / FGSC 9543 / NRRL 43880) TaxID=246409 RepID=I1CK73_RHIO9|nr:hypothetical protein RO3G_13564 [Rhizopus delemar RA 99-880]|eukprot:EIE88853.1 hypothetical protein RO3G_13564 [Rhizopus delemar RA 99-880]